MYTPQLVVTTPPHCPLGEGRIGPFVNTIIALLESLAMCLAMVGKHLVYIRPFTQPYPKQEQQLDFGLALSRNGSATKSYKFEMHVRINVYISST